MNLHAFITRYHHAGMCRSWNNNIPLEQINAHADRVNLEFKLETDSQDIRALCEIFPFLPADEITGCMVSEKNGDYIEVYVTESSRPYDLQAVYHPLVYYLD